MARFVEDLLFAEDERMFWRRYRDALAARTPAEITEDRVEAELWAHSLADDLEPEDWSDHEPPVR
jgi:hypothetical protein